MTAGSNVIRVSWFMTASVVRIILIPITTGVDFDSYMERAYFQALAHQADRPDLQRGRCATGCHEKRLSEIPLLSSVLDTALPSDIPSCPIHVWDR